MNVLTRVKNIALDVFFPPLCLGCKKTLSSKKSPICADCWSKIKIQNGFFCVECGARLPEIKKVCHQDAYLIGGATEIYGHEPLTELVKLLKYSGIKSAADVLGGLLNQYVLSLNLPLKLFTIVPIPLPQKRLRQRGYNQSEVIAQELLLRYTASHKIDGKPPEVSLLQALERKFTKPQTEMKNYEARQKNVASCFSVTDKNLIADKNIILIDDVYTSGSTMKEAARVLKLAGAKKIIGLTVLKAG